MQLSGLAKKVCERARAENGNIMCFSSAPARCDFLNTHQDYKMLPVVPAAIWKRTFVACSKLNERGVVRVKSLTFEREGFESEDVFQSGEVELLKGKWFGNYFRSIHRLVSQKYGMVETGLAIYVDSEVPVASGLASSAALHVSLAAMYSELLGLCLSRMGLAELAYEAEHDVMGIPCGRLDQYAASYGGIVKLDFKPSVSVEELNGEGIFFTVADSGIRHSTAEIHPVRQCELNAALKMLREASGGSLSSMLEGDFASVEWRMVREEHLKDFLSVIPPRLASRVLFTLRMQASTEVALQILKYRMVRRQDLEKLGLNPVENWLQALGEVVNLQHTLLRDLYEVSHEKLEAMRDSALEAGALGVKISGAGMGGSLIALVKNMDDTPKVEEAFLRAGAQSVFTTGVGPGVSATLLG
ncbi:MAG: GHMP kinase [Crenarchaeota archaeon]|nr:GHMP kinase [Thermoproteota archaeon]